MIKHCTQCGLEKDLINFYRDRLKKDGLRCECKQCSIAMVRRYQSTDRGKKIALKSELKRSGTITRRTSHNRANSHYKKTERGRIINHVYSHRRRELKFGLDSTFTKDDILEVHDRFNHQCFRCGTTEHLSIDHHRPLIDGNGLSSVNAVLLCIKCNCSKGTKQPEQFYDQDQLEVLHGLGII